MIGYLCLSFNRSTLFLYHFYSSSSQENISMIEVWNISCFCSFYPYVTDVCFLRNTLNGRDQTKKWWFPICLHFWYMYKLSSISSFDCRNKLRYCQMNILNILGVYWYMYMSLTFTAIFSRISVSPLLCTIWLLSALNKIISFLRKKSFPPWKMFSIISFRTTSKYRVLEIFRLIWHTRGRVDTTPQKGFCSISERISH